jgi:hypothetical protein
LTDKGWKADCGMLIWNLNFGDNERCQWALEVVYFPSKAPIIYQIAALGDDF